MIVTKDTSVTKAKMFAENPQRTPHRQEQACVSDIHQALYATVLLSSDAQPRALKSAASPAIPLQGLLTSVMPASSRMAIRLHADAIPIRTASPVMNVLQITSVPKNRVLKKSAPADAAANTSVMPA